MNDEQLWAMYAAAALGASLRAPYDWDGSPANAADELLAEHRKRWPKVEPESTWGSANLTEEYERAGAVSELSMSMFATKADYEKALAESKDGWIPWHGGENPVPGKRVLVRGVDGRTYPPKQSSVYYWHHEYCPPDMGDIVAYKVIGDE